MSILLLNVTALFVLCDPGLSFDEFWSSVEWGDRDELNTQVSDAIAFVAGSLGVFTWLRSGRTDEKITRCQI